MQVCGRVMALCLGGVLLFSLVAEAQWRWTPQTGRFVNVKRLPKETAELQVEFARTLMVQGKHRDALRETGKFRDFYGDSDQADDNQFLRGEIRLDQDSHKSAAKEFQRVVTEFPDTDLYDAVIEKQYEVGDALFDLGTEKTEGRGKRSWKRLGIRWSPFKKRPFKHAIDVYSMVIDNQPFTHEAAEAQFKVGLCHFARDEYVESAYEYSRVIEDYADSEWVVDASYGLARCYEGSSMTADYDQAPSFLAIDAIDSFAARYPGDARGGELVEVRAAMRENIAEQRLRTGQFYERRRLFDSARLYFEVVVEQFPETEAAVKAQEWLDQYPAR